MENLERDIEAVREDGINENSELEIEELGEIADIEDDSETTETEAAIAPELAPDFNSVPVESPAKEEEEIPHENPEVLIPQGEEPKANPIVEQSFGSVNDNTVLPGGNVIANDKEAAVTGLPAAGEAEHPRERRNQSRQNASLSIDANAGLVDDNSIKDELLSRFGDNDPTEAEDETWRLIQRYKDNRQIIHSRLIGVERVEKNVYMITSFRGMRIVIPYFEYFADDFVLPAAADPENDTEAAKLNRIARTAGYQLNCEIPFIIMGCSRERLEDSSEVVYGQLPYKYTIVASRRRALNAYKNHYFLQKSGPLVKRGSVVKPRVISVSEGTVRVECLGVDTSIYAFDLSGKEFVDDCRNFVHPGDTLVARVSKLYINEEEDEKGNIVRTPHLSVSPRLFDIGATGRNLNEMRVNGLYLGTVRSQNKSNGVYTVILDNQVIAAVARDSVIGGRPLFIGDRVSIRVRQVLDSYVRGIALKL